MILKTSMPFDVIKGIYWGIFYEFDNEIIFAKYLGFDTKLRLGENIPKFKTFDLGSSFKPFSFFKMYFDYRYRDFSKYRIGEHNFLILSEIILNFVKYVNLNFFQGANFRVIDLNIDDYKTVYKTDWLFDSFFLLKIQLLFHPVFLYSFGFSLGNIDDFEIFSVNYWQVEMVNYFHLPKGFSIFVNGGLAFAGLLPDVPVLNRFWVRTGFRYEIKLH